ncbi:MAG: hypothetical protein ACK50J_02545 [Planctomyces sp.]
MKTWTNRQSCHGGTPSRNVINRQSSLKHQICRKQLNTPASDGDQFTSDCANVRNHGEPVRNFMQCLRLTEQLPEKRPIQNATAK